MLSRLDAKLVTRQPDWGGTLGGYADESYVRSLAEFGRLLRLPRSRSWLLERLIPGRKDRDAIGAYPFFACESIEELQRDLARLDGTLVSAAVVPDPFSVGSPESLSKAFDVVRPFKRHYLVDLEIGFDAYMRRHHRRYSKRALSSVAVEIADDPPAHAAEWARMYEHVVARHRLSGLTAFSPKALGLQLAVPGCCYFRALHDGSLEGALVCYLDRGVAYAHLVSTTPKGQDLMAQYALYWTAIEYFRGRARWFALGSVPGQTDGSPGTGLGFFKAGWATASCQAYFCGRILDKNRYSELCAPSLGHTQSGYFPAYRSGDVG